MTIVAETNRAIEAVWKIERARLIGGLTRMVRDVGLAEELAQDALVAAAKDWPVSGIPDRPAAWLTTTAKRLALNRLRRDRQLERNLKQIGHETEGSEQPDIDAVLDDPVGDDLLALIFIACHPILAAEARVALTLRPVCGLTTPEIARAFLTSEATIQQRIVRAKRTLADAGVPFEVPRGEALTERLTSVLSVIYLIFNEGYAPTSGDNWIRPQMAQEALRVGRIVAGLAGGEPEVHGLNALMELQSSRFAARTGPEGEPVLLLDQNRARWDQAAIRRGFAALERARNLLGERQAGSYLLQAELAACHARARTSDETDWVRIVQLYDTLTDLTPSPLIELHRAVAVGFAYGPAAGLELTDQLAAEPALEDYHLLPAIRGDLLAKLGRHDQAAAEFDRAVALTQNVREREVLSRRAAEARGAAVQA